MSKKINSRKYLEDIYRKLGNQKHDFRNYNLTNLIISKIKGKYILDIGCGSGYLLSRLNKIGKKTKGIEPNKKLIKLAKEINPGLHIINGITKDINKIKQEADTITMIDVLEHIKNDNLQIKKIHAYLKKGGQFILVVPSFRFLYGKRDKNAGHYRRYSKTDLIQKLSKGGFKIRHIQFWNMLGFFPYLFYEKILKKELNTELRIKKEQISKKLISKLINLWFKYIENNLNLGFGLSIICVAVKK